MGHEEEMYTIEFEDIPSGTVPSGSVPYGIALPGTISAGEKEPFNLFDEKYRKAEKVLADDYKHQEFLRLRDSINRMNKAPVNNCFLEQAKKYADLDSGEIQHVPFSCYWPTYDAMSDAQKAWYFYWRSLARKGSYPGTDLSYIFTYIYELLNNVGVDDGQDGFLKLCLIWGGYRVMYPRLDKYMVLWIEDYALINCKDGISDEIIAGIGDFSLLNLLPDFVVADYILNRNEPGLLVPGILEFISRFTSYRFYSSKFCQSKNGSMLLENIPPLMCNLNSYLTNKTGKGIFASFKPQTVQSRKRMPFQNAVYQGEVRSIAVDVYDCSKNKALRAFITSVIKQLENVLREITGYKGRLSVDLPKDISTFIKEYITRKLRNEEAERRANIEIDSNKIKQLIEDSNSVREKLLWDTGTVLLSHSDDDINSDDLLLAASEDDYPLPLPYDDFEHKPISEEYSGIIMPVPANSEDVPRDVSEDDSTDDYYGELMTRLTDCQKDILTCLITRGGETTENELASSFPGIFIQTEIDDINDAAIDCLGDILIIIEDSIIKIEKV